MADSGDLVGADLHQPRDLLPGDGEGRRTRLVE
jgi:hypothetical protein